MPAIRHPRRATLFAVGLLVTGAFATLGSAPAFSYTQIYGSGAALQSLLQNNVLIPKSAQIGGFVTFTATTSGKGFEELGDKTGVLEPTLDTTAYANGKQLDAFTATDSGPTQTQLNNAQTAAGSTATNEISVPVAQTPLDLLLSLPTGITLNSAQNIDLTAPLAGELYGGTAPAAGGYLENTWGAFLIDAGLTAETTNSSPGLGEFYDTGASGAKTGGYTPIVVEIRKEGAGTTLNLKQYLLLVDKELGSGPWSGSILEDANAYGTNEWPTTATLTPDNASGNSTDANEVEAVDKTPGTIGYATAGDTSETTPTKFTSLPLSSTDYSSSSHQILYALLQDNFTGAAGARTLPIYADPQANSSGTANVYTGANIDVNGNAAGGVGSWVVPNTSGTFNADGTWTGTRASDPDVYDDSGDLIAYYPLVAVAFDLSWSNFSVGNLITSYAKPGEAQATAQAFLEFATSTTGQDDIAGHYFYAPLPSDLGNSGLANIDAVAHSAAGGV